ncbi:hypothetical protein SAMN05216474_2972 [Lishizhenia tianjinensis]|uniref:Rieske domain-containing protein n=1 Tax=Lishizhenia tianjinensis TaxID=477690 RepID=A0A1I7BPL2_9FLAO|nr:hypothetical protein [Lishizhenia tianjinensis]SFT89112.1 hypothetical protein SAMN05216474_2972 [Lishizhenia tianjinensis]
MKFLLAFLLILSVSFGCNKTKNHPVPSLPFDTEINLTLPSYSNLQNVSGYAYVLGGVKGLVVYRRGPNDFVCFDRMSTAENAAECDSGLLINPDNFLVLDDPCSDAQYSLYDGSIVKGEVEFGLRQYITVWDGNTKLRIYNQ